MVIRDVSNLLGVIELGAQGRKTLGDNRRLAIAKWARRALMTLPVGVPFVIGGIVGIPIWFLVDPIKPSGTFKRGATLVLLPFSPVVGAYFGGILAYNAVCADVWRPKDVWDAAWDD